MPELTGLTALQTACQALLDAAVATFTEHEIGLPERRLITVQRPAGDTELVAAFTGRVYPGLPGAQAARPQPCGGPVAAEVLLEVWRCHPTVDGQGMTTPAQELGASASRHTDLLLMIAAADRAASALDLDGEALTGAAVIVAPPGGGLSGVQAVLVIPLPRL